MGTLTLAAGWIITFFLGTFAGLILWYVLAGKINLQHLIAESDGQASLSRFQFLIFTFVIAMSLFFVIAGQDPPMFPNEIPAGIFALLGISGGSYVISKSIQKNKREESTGGGDDPGGGDNQG
jgi:uncharacterized BrkB/YihY/UPF0761 family membrane protein